MHARLELTREQILAFRRAVNHLEARLPPGPDSLRRAAWAGLQDSMPRAALLSLHARVEGIEPASLDEPSLAQLWGPRFQVYVVAREDFALFSLGRYPDAPSARERAERAATTLREHLRGERRTEREIGTALGIDPNSLKYGTATGTIEIRWDGARSPLVWSVPAPETTPADARRDLARRYLHVFAPGAPERFAAWAGIKPAAAAAAFASLADELVPVRSPLGDDVLLAADEQTMREATGGATQTRLLPSGDAYWLLAGAERALLVPPADRRNLLWTSRVWPGALLVDGEIRGTWRRSQHVLRVDCWGRQSQATRSRVEAEAATLPLPLERDVVVTWD